MEMGRRDLMRREGANRFSKKQSGKRKNDLISVSETNKRSGFAAKTKRVMLKKQEMGYEFHPSGLENDVTIKKSKLRKKNLKVTNGVDHASVPRKLRSAMKKRNLESVSKLPSSASKRLNRSKTGIESCKKDLVMKENQEMEAKASVPESMMISKDEKEVAETLYGLAEMFTENDSIDKKTCDEKETSKADSILVMEAGFNKAELLEQTVSVLSSAKTKLIDEMPLEKPINSTGLKQNSSVNVTGATARAIETKVVTSGVDYKNNGLVLWPGLYSTVHSGDHDLSKPSSTKLPPWMGQAVSPSKSASEPVRVQPRKLKKCASHVYISRFIKVLQTSKSSALTTNQIELSSSETSEHRLSDPVTTISDFKTMVSPSKRYENPNLLDLHKTHNPKPVQEDMTKLDLELYNPYTSQKQSYDFLCLSSNGAAQSHFPLPNSLPQYHISAPYNSQLSPATSSHQVQQLPPYLTSRFQTAYNANQRQQQQLQKRLWAAQYRPTSGNTVPPSSNQFSKPNLSLNMTSIQPLQVTSPRYNGNVSQQQHRLMAAAMSMSHHHNNPSRTVMNRQEHHFPFICEDTRTPLQLLCNKQS